MLKCEEFEFSKISVLKTRRERERERERKNLLAVARLEDHTSIKCMLVRLVELLLRPKYPLY
jgi:capsule polysaccharide export protein KpsC/LpsZ